jgi:hypothetical protein
MKIWQKSTQFTKKIIPLFLSEIRKPSNIKPVGPTVLSLFHTLMWRQRSALNQAPSLPATPKTFPLGLWRATMIPGFGTKT